MSLSVLFVIGVTIALPDRVHVFPRGLFPVVVLVLLIALIATDPGAITIRSRKLRALSITLVLVMVGGSLAYTTVLINDLLNNAPGLQKPGPLLSSGAAVWLMNIVAFALLYWQFDCGGAAMRAHGMPAHPDIAFPQQLNPELAPPDWRPEYVDYLFMSITTSVAFSPTDAMPLSRWVKIAMAVEALISLAILGLVIARAVNAFT
ncbi:MAG TPA: hypothetical protein VK646_07590 [Actinomycetota bacterium]|nr:hypothetical protein [Actinomycetota bacterium]